MLIHPVVEENIYQKTAINCDSAGRKSPGHHERFYGNPSNNCSYFQAELKWWTDQQTLLDPCCWYIYQYTTIVWVNIKDLMIQWARQENVKAIIENREISQEYINAS